jgi:hypothetical protein
MAVDHADIESLGTGDFKMTVKNLSIDQLYKISCRKAKNECDDYFYNIVFRARAVDGEIVADLVCIKGTDGNPDRWIVKNDAIHYHDESYTDIGAAYACFEQRMCYWNIAQELPTDRIEIYCTKPFVRSI